MTQSNENAVVAAKPQATNTPFNLIITTSRPNAAQIAKHYDLSEVRYVDDIPHLPDGGAARGKALNALLAKYEQTLTLVVLLEDAWVKALLTDASLASSVWRGVEGKLFGFNTDKQRNLVIVALDVNGDVRRAEDNLQLRSVTSGRRLSIAWRPARPAVEKPAAEAAKPSQPKVAKQQAKRNEPAQGKPEQQKNQKTKGAAPAGDAEGQKAPKQAVKKTGKLDRSKKHTGPGGEFNTRDNSLTNDLYLLCRGHYGVNTSQVLIEKAKRLITFRTNQQEVSTNQVGRLLFVTLSRLSSRSYWKSYQVLQSIINAGSESPAQLANTLAGHISNSPTYDENSREIPLPALSEAVTKLLDERFVEFVAPAEPLAAVVEEARVDSTAA